MDGPTSFTHENVGRLLIKVLDGFQGIDLGFKSLTFGENALRDLHLSNIWFKDCTFGGTSLENAHLVNCKFEECHFGQINLHLSTKVENCSIIGGDLVSIALSEKENPIFDPTAFPAILRKAGFELPLNPVSQGVNITEDPDIATFKRFLKLFQVKTHLDEWSVRKKLGDEAELFLQNVLPLLVKAGVLLSETNEKDKQHWFRLTMSMERIYEALQSAPKTIDSFVSTLNGKE